MTKAETAKNKVSDHNINDDKVICEEVKLDVNRSKSIRALTLEFKKIPREILISGLWYELTNFKQTESIVMPLLYFLSSTENKKDVRGFYKTTTWLLVDTEDQSKVLKHWPKRPVLNVKNIDKEKLCELFMKTQEGSKK